MRNHRIYTLATLFILTAIYSAVWAQQVHVNVTRLQNPLPPQITTYYENPGRFFSVSITNTDTKVPVPVRLEFSLVGPIEGGMDVWPASSSSYFMLSSNRSLPTGFIIAPGQTRFISSMELSQHMMSYPTSSYYAGGAISEAMSTAKEGVFGLLDEGHYGIKMVAKTNYDGEAGDVIGESTAYFDICYSATAPSFTYPQSEGFDFTAEYDVIRFPVEYAHFEWTVPQFNLQSLARNRQFTYEFKLYRMLPNQSPEEAVASNGIAFQQPGLLTPFCNIPYNVVENLKHSGTKHFVAQVTATPIVSDDHNPDYTQINNSGKSALMILKLTDDDMENVGVVDNGLTIEEGNEGEQGFKVTIEPKFNKLTNELAPYFETPSKLFRLTVENKTGEDQTISLLLQFFKDNWGVCPSPNKQHSTKSLTIMSGETITLSDEQLDDLAGGYPYSDIIAFKAKTGFIIGKPAQNTFPGTEYTVSARVCKFTGKPVLREEALGSARADFVTDGEVAIDDIFKITFESRIDPVPTDVSTLFTHPSRHFTATIENLSSIAYDLRPVLSFRLLGDTIYMGGYIRRLNESLHIEPGEVLEFSDMNIDEMCGGFTEIYKIYDEDEHTDTIQDFSTVLPAPDGNTVQLSLFDANLLRTLYPNDKDYTSKSLLQDATLDFSSSASAFMGDVDVTITPKSTPMPGNIGAYFNKTSQLFDVTLTNTTNRMLKVSPRLMYKLTDDGSIQKINGTPYSQYYIALKPRTSYTLTEDDHRTFFTSKSILSYAVNQEGEFADIPDTIHIVPNFFNDEDGLISLDEKNYAHIDIFDYDLLQMDKENPSDAIRGKGDCEFSASADYQLFDVSVGITPLMNPMPGDGAAYARMPGKLFGITLTNNTDKPIRGIPSIRYKFKDKTYVYTPHAEQYGKEYRLLEPKAKVTLPANEFTRMAGGERMIRTGGKEKADTLETLDDILDFEAENSVCVLVVDYDTLNALPKDTPDLMTRILRGAASHDFMADSTVHIGDVTITIAPRDDKMSDKATDYFTTPGKYFDVKLRNTGGSEQKVGLRLTLNEKYYGVSDSTLILPPDSTVTLTEEMLNNLCGGIPSERIFQLDTIDNNIQRKVAQEMKLLDGQNSIQALVWQLPKDLQLATMGENVDTLSLESTTFITSFRDVQIGEFILSILESKPVAKKDSCYSGKGYITWNAMGFPIKIAVEFDSIYINQEAVVYRGLVKSAERKGFGEIIPCDLFDGVIDGEDVEDASEKIEDLLSGTDFAQYYTYVTETLEAIPIDFQEGQATLTLPLRMPEYVKEESPVDIQLLSMEFRPDKASMSLLAQFVLPETNYVTTAENILVFGSPHLGMSDSTLIPKTGDLALLSDLTIKDPSSGFNITFLAPNSKEPLSNSGCYVAWEDGEFGEFVVDAKMAIPSEDILKDEEGKVTEGVAPDIRLTARIADKEDWFGQIRMDAFQLKDAPGYTFTLAGSEAGVLYDHSKRTTPEGVTIPEEYDWSQIGLKKGDLDEWQGFYFEELSVELPTFIELHDNGEDKRLKVGLFHTIYDDSGFSCEFAAKNIFDQHTTSLGGWRMSLDEIDLTILQSEFSKFGFNGKFEIPLLEGAIGYDAKVFYADKNTGKTIAKEGSEEKQTISSEEVAREDRAIKMVFETRQTDSLKLDFFACETNFKKEETYFNITYFDGDTDVELCLGGDISIAGFKSEKSPVSFAIPGIEFYGMRLANFKRKEELKDNLYSFASESGDLCFDLGRWTLGSLVLGGNSAKEAEKDDDKEEEKKDEKKEDEKKEDDKLPEIDSDVEYGLNIAGFSIGIEKFNIATNTEGDFGLYVQAKTSLLSMITAEAGFTIWASIDLDEISADYKETTFNDISVESTMGGMYISGSLQVKNDEEHGDGYAGDLKFKLPGNLFTVDASGGYFRKEHSAGSGHTGKYSWGYFELAVGSKALGSIQPVSISDIGGGFYFNCNDQHAPVYGVIGAKFLIGLTAGGDNVVAGKFDALMLYDMENDRMTKLQLSGKAHVMGGSVEEEGAINADATIIYEHNDKKKYFQLTVSVDAVADMTEIAQKMVAGYVPGIKSAMAGLQGAFGQSDEDIADAGAERSEDGNEGKQQLKASAGFSFNLDLLIEFKTQENPNPKWHLWIGKPQPESERCQVTFIDFQLGDKDDPVAMWAKVWVNAYFCIGNDLPIGPNGQVLPPIPAEVQEFLDGESLDGRPQNLSAAANTKRNDAVQKLLNGGIKGGMMFGAAAGATIGANMAIAYFDVTLMGGFDIALVKLAEGGSKCSNNGKTMKGINGYYATGQAYVLLKGEIGLMINLWIFSGKIALIEAGLGANIQAGFAHPTWFYGKARAKCKLFGGLISFNQAIEIEAGDVCVPYYANPLQDIEIFGDIYPEYDNKTDGWEEENEISPYAIPRFTTNMQIGTPIRLLDETRLAQLEADGYNTSGTGSRNAERTYRFMLGTHTVKEYATPNGSLARQYSVNAINTTGDRTNYTLELGALKPDTCYHVRLIGYAQEQKGGVWGRPWFCDEESNYVNVQRHWGDTCEFYFRTKSLPPHMTDDDVALARPDNWDISASSARAFMSELERPYLCMKRSRADLFKSGYDMVARIEYWGGSQYKTLGKEVPIREYIENEGNAKYITWRVTQPIDVSMLRNESLRHATYSTRFTILRINRSKYNQYLREGVEKIVKSSIQYEKSTLKSSTKQELDRLGNKSALPTTGQKSSGTQRAIGGQTPPAIQENLRGLRNDRVLQGSDFGEVNMTELLAQFDSEMQAEMKKDNVEHQIRDFVQSVDMNDFAEVIYNYPFGYVYEETLKDYVISEINKGRLNPNNYNFNAGIDVLLYDLDDEDGVLSHSKSRNNNTFLHSTKQRWAGSTVPYAYVNPYSAFLYLTDYAYYGGIEMKNYNYNRTGDIYSSESGTWKTRYAAEMYYKPTPTYVGSPLYSVAYVEYNSNTKSNTLHLDHTLYNYEYFWNTLTKGSKGWTGSLVLNKSEVSLYSFQERMNQLSPKVVRSTSYTKRDNKSNRWPYIHNRLLEMMETDAVLAERFTKQMREYQRQFEDYAVKSKTATKIDIDADKARTWMKVRSSWDQCVAGLGNAYQCNYILLKVYQIPYMYGILNDHVYEIIPQTRRQYARKIIDNTYNYYFNASHYLNGMAYLQYRFMRPNGYNVKQNDGTRNSGLVVRPGAESTNIYTYKFTKPYKSYEFLYNETR